MPYNEAAKRAQSKYDSANTTAVMMKLNNKSDTDILTKLSSVENKQGYIKSLIRSDLKEHDPISVIDDLLNEVTSSKSTNKTYEVDGFIVDYESPSTLAAIRKFVELYKERLKNKA